ncbi:SCO family protein [Pseudomonas sp. ABC1]|uniref:SCO family protein n=1 Tax=Pseudomonas sp. ABC1 TaxID=2748080 RepID=UPI0015C2D4AA|nr:SCO family protein [Pseudomonas sp. ABC1]QLF93435.1 SCO family protein [Pseudomonas sp. ABC1]
MRYLRYSIPLMLLALLAALLLNLSQRPAGLDPQGALEAGIILLPEARELPPAELTSLDGQAFGPAFFSGKWTLMLFGYTFCPDICPTALSELRALYTWLPPEARERLRVVMVSVDPQRDSAEQLQRYVSHFHRDFIGLRGELEVVQTAANTLGLSFIPGDTTQPYYTVDHSGHLALIDPEGRQRGFVRGPLRVEALVEHLPALLGQDQ